MNLSCTSEPKDPSWVRDDLWCWHKDADGDWKTTGPSSECPEGSVYGSVFQFRK